MTENLSDTIRRLYTDPGEYIDSDHPSVRDFAISAVAADAGARDKASLLYKAVRDGIRYNPYVNMRTPETLRASSVLAAGNGYCVGKAALYAAACRVHGIPARVGFADVRNHLTTEKLRREHGHRSVQVARLLGSPCRRRLAQGNPDLQRHAVRQGRRASRSISTATAMRCCIPSTVRAAPTWNMSPTTGRTSTFPQNS